MNDASQRREAADLLRLLGHPLRLALLDELAKGPKCVSDIQELLDVRQANLSQHLSVLRQARIVDFHEDGNLRCYYIARPSLVAALTGFLGSEHPIVPCSAAWVRRAARRRNQRSAAGPSDELTEAGHPAIATAEDQETDRAEHWNQVYTQKADADLSWYQVEATPSLAILDQVPLPRNAAIIDIGGGGPSALVGELLDRGFTCLSVLDVSAAGLQRCRQRLGDRANRVTWLEADVTGFMPPQQYDLWHDRAVFHFLTELKDQQAYLAALHRGLKPGGYAIIATFAPDGPPSCSDLDVARWAPDAMAEAFGGAFTPIESFRETHQTPWGKPQAFVYCLFRRVGTPEPAEGKRR
ncbi:MAG: metalloregulator ArsR/SmtB family transcription factor [Anaerolineaceae bacterium]|nr:metalloregulator ArsR/SmtB family transcription factor [Anaerolineaceae bacterium]